MMVNFKTNFKYNFKKKPIYYGIKLYNLNTLIKTIIKLNNKLCKLVMEICYSKVNTKIHIYFIYVSYHNR